MTDPNQLKRVRTSLRESFPGPLTLDVGTGGRAVIQVVSDRFDGLTARQRRDAVAQVLAAADLTPTLTSLYTQKEAELLGLTPEDDADGTTRPLTWGDVVTAMRSGHTTRSPDEVDRPGLMRRVVFYSYKGGVGRTTSLIHTAALLAKGGLSVVLVDMDLEAPGLRALMPPGDSHTTTNTGGVLDFLWEQCVEPKGMKKEYPLARFAYPVEVPGASSHMIVLPAGDVDAGYISRLSALESLPIQDLDAAWGRLEQKVMDEFSPDLMFVDARTGFNRWGGLSLLGRADEIFVVAYPSPQNVAGLQTILDLLTGARHSAPQVVFSAVPEGAVGRQLVEVARQALRLPSEDELATEEDFDGPEEGEELDGEVPASGPALVVHEVAGLRSADRLPLESAMLQYEDLAWAIRAQSTTSDLIDRLSGDARWGIIDSLTFPEVTPKDFDYSRFYQLTPDFDRVIADSNQIVIGRMGTGKTTLYKVLVSKPGVAQERSKTTLAHIKALSGHGSANAYRPSGRDQFHYFSKKLDQTAWTHLWRAYAVFVLWRDGVFTEYLGEDKLPELRTFLRSSFGEPGAEQPWLTSHSEHLLTLAQRRDTHDALMLVDQALKTQDRRVWLLYDDLDQDLGLDDPWSHDALASLFQLQYDLANLSVRHLQLRSFIRYDLWDRLNFNNKSHFGRTRKVVLQWSREDFLRLAYRLATGGSEAYKLLAEELLGIPNFDPDSADEEGLRNALAPLWGLHTEKSKRGYAARWVYSRMSDTRGNAFPRALAELLQGAKEHERTYRETSVRAPSDRLLRRRSLVKGATKASEQRAQDLRNEFKARLGSFLDETKTLKSKFSRTEIEKVFLRTAKSHFDDLDDFLKLIQDIGLVEPLARKSAYDFQFAKLYLDGLGIQRVQGEKK